ncbi:MAG: hypothetical protein AB2768_09085, partial [Candidatus Thiodiazotropha endolucinida]
SGLEPSSETTAPRYLKLVTVPSFCPFTFIYLWMPLVLFAKQEGSSQILVKFFRYHDKRRVFALKRNLKNNASKTFLTEDLTAINHSVVKTLLPMKKDGKIDSFWTRDGRIIVKKDKDSNPVRVSPNANIERSLGL